MNRSNRRRTESAFTLVETMVAIGVLGLALEGIYMGMMKINEYAEANRLNSCATQIVLSEIDNALSVRPFYPTTAGGADPFDDTRNTSSTDKVPSSLMITHALGTPVVTKPTIFSDPDVLAGITVTNPMVVTGTLSVVATEASITTGGTAATTGTSQLRNINVSLVYQYRGQSHTVQMSCLRAPDQ